MAAIDRMKKDGTFETLSKKEKLQVDRLRAKLEKNLGSISDMTRLPGALFVVDIRREHIAVREAQKLNIPIFAMVDTNADPREVDYAIPANDDASKSIDKILALVAQSVGEGLSERKQEKAAAEAAETEGEVVPETATETEEVVEEATVETEEVVAEEADIEEAAAEVEETEEEEVTEEETSDEEPEEESKEEE
jgi:small subunit ribosomal protein S2